MNKKILIAALLIILSLFSTHSVVAERVVENTAGPQQIETKQLDKESQILAAYLASRNSPLQYHAQDFVDAAKVYNLDWRLVAAISGVESTFGKFIPGGYNGWGWGVYGTQAIYFSSWRDGIFTVSKGLRENYLNRGLTDPHSINRAYAASPYWGSKVSYFMNDLARFAQNYETETNALPKVGEHPQIAVISGQLAFE